MGMRRIAGIPGSAGVVAAGALTAAPPASAYEPADYSIDACAGTHVTFPVGANMDFVAFGPCEFDLPIDAWTPDTAPDWVSNVGLGGNGAVRVTFLAYTDWIAFSMANGVGWDVPYVGDCGASEALWSWTVISHCGTSGESTPPPSWHQSYQRTSAAGTCLDGWNPSWAQWANHHAGGYVCDRGEYWSQGAQGWAFR
jgi:hypothetical protein